MGSCLSIKFVCAGCASYGLLCLTWVHVRLSASLYVQVVRVSASLYVQVCMCKFVSASLYVQVCMYECKCACTHRQWNDTPSRCWCRCRCAASATSPGVPPSLPARVTRESDVRKANHVNKSSLSEATSIAQPLKGHVAAAPPPAHRSALQDEKEEEEENSEEEEEAEQVSQPWPQMALVASPTMSAAYSPHPHPSPEVCLCLCLWLCLCL